MSSQAQGVLEHGGLGIQALSQNVGSEPFQHSRDLTGRIAPKKVLTLSTWRIQGLTSICWMVSLSDVQ